MSLRRTIPAAALAVGLLAGACSDSTGLINLAPDDIGNLFSEIGVESPSLNNTGTINTTAICSGGGSASIAGVIDTGTANGTTTASFNVTETFSNCKTAHYTVGGPVKLTGNFGATQTTVSGSAAATGTLRVNTVDGRSGNCAIDASVNLSGSSSNPTTAPSGTICGLNVQGLIL